MLDNIRSLGNQFFRKSRKINNEPLNKVSLVVIIVIDIFILINVFTGLDDVSRWYISPSQAYPCYSQWQNYREETNTNKDYEIISSSLSDINNQISQEQIYQEVEERHLGKVSQTCLQYAKYQDQINISQNQQIIQNIVQKQTQVSQFEQKNSTIRAQYDSTLLEKIAGQSPEQSINVVGAEKAKQELDKNNQKISTLKQEISNLKNQLVTKPESIKFLAFLQNDNKFQPVEVNYQQASFWYPSIQLAFQALFLLPLILVALSVHNFTQRREYGLISLISWHLLVIFFLPLILKIFEFLQVGILFTFIFDILRTILGGLLFLVSYVYILVIPLLGFVIIQLFQKVILNTKAQAVRRVQDSRCINCAKKIRHNDKYCPHCGYYQYIECANCHNLTYKYLSHCHHCGTFQDSSHNHV
ncbi:zinc ribbon domain-containing protein [Nodularia spumigena CS-584]|jgi:predicted RNA-binding Zn-ribbon protein involved in translation (DUF1610 family)|uniref:DZANK-type domain-containing protein n=2 Tax=Nodularia spumigena TaxID=70799 RepID=A0A2S0Q129_NODSP|nr:zinc ribbon domain-containing protein [Nodularia spumigena]AHJ27461.1 ATPase involved in DNA repair [Nodularia spumigena CCY9414]AVZ30416.1 hypothetical protein BMF81_01971 [Nodularia spumigena UHCC 0039]EAW46032.1 hypothetical protein N9414_10373 [Nodularia spumigena CCY9414]MDB9380833.1 zinc ribbon domain-containing protein [Nodularia spumigena CS-584]MEA5523971.1 zinc ribbon domain-containing protein [Nodularia spumigena UHCC 0143]